LSASAFSVSLSVNVWINDGGVMLLSLAQQRLALARRASISLGAVPLVSPT
jgi:hypothetical protein